MQFLYNVSRSMPIIQNFKKLFGYSKQEWSWTKFFDKNCFLKVLKNWQNHQNIPWLTNWQIKMSSLWKNFKSNCGRNWLRKSTFCFSTSNGAACCKSQLKGTTGLCSKFVMAIAGKFPVKSVPEKTWTYHPNTLCIGNLEYVKGHPQQFLFLKSMIMDVILFSQYAFRVRLHIAFFSPFFSPLKMRSTGSNGGVYMHITSKRSKLPSTKTGWKMLYWGCTAGWRTLQPWWIELTTAKRFTVQDSLCKLLMCGYASPRLKDITIREDCMCFGSPPHYVCFSSLSIRKTVLWRL